MAKHDLFYLEILEIKLSVEDELTFKVLGFTFEKSEAIMEKGGNHHVLSFPKYS